MTKKQLAIRESEIIMQHADGLITDEEFVRGIEKLYEERLIGKLDFNPKALQIWYDEGHAAIVLKHPNTPEIKIPIERCGVNLTAWGMPLANQRGWEILIRLLRDNAKQNCTATIGMPAAPIQHMVDGWIRGVN